MFINTVESIEGSFTDFNRVVYAYVLALIKKQSDDNLGFSTYWQMESYISAGKDEEQIFKK